jgi:hypothetical protein
MMSALPLMQTDPPPKIKITSPYILVIILHVSCHIPDLCLLVRLAVLKKSLIICKKHEFDPLSKTCCFFKHARIVTKNPCKEVFYPKILQDTFLSTKSQNKMFIPKYL